MSAMPSKTLRGVSSRIAGVDTKKEGLSRCTATRYGMKRRRVHPCHPEEASIASGTKDLGQLRAMRSRFRFLIRALRALHSLAVLRPPSFG